MSVDKHSIEEVLEAIWVAEETKGAFIENIKIVCERDGHVIDVKAVLDELVRLNLVKFADDRFQLMPDGTNLAGDIMRRHRLAERLFTDVFQVSESTMELTACQFEHILTSEVVDSVCAYLGHPPLCPHGRPIPPGDCCKTYQRDQVKPLVIRLCDLELGKEGKIAFVAPSVHDRYNRLTALGVIAGNPIKLHQREPSFVVSIGETELAFEQAIAREIYVKAP